MGKTPAVVKHAMLSASMLLLGGCWAGFSDEFTAAECDAFAGQYQMLGGIQANAALDETGRDEVRRRTVRDCRGGTLGLSREEYQCAMKAGSREDWAACRIVLKG